MYFYFYSSLWIPLTINANRLWIQCNHVRTDFLFLVCATFPRKTQELLPSDSLLSVTRCLTLYKSSLKNKNKKVLLFGGEKGEKQGMLGSKDQVARHSGGGCVTERSLSHTGPLCIASAHLRPVHQRTERGQSVSISLYHLSLIGQNLPLAFPAVSPELSRHPVPGTSFLPRSTGRTQRLPAGACVSHPVVTRVSFRCQHSPWAGMGRETGYLCCS